MADKCTTHLTLIVFSYTKLQPGPIIIYFQVNKQVITPTGNNSLVRPHNCSYKLLFVSFSMFKFVLSSLT